MTPLSLGTSLLVLSGLLACTSRDSTVSQLKYPPARTVDSVDVLHGTRVPDPYRWLEDLESQEVKDWAAAQTALALPLLRNNEVGPWAFKRMKELEAFWHDSTEADTEEPPLIDNSKLQANQSITEIWPSPDRKHAAYAVSTNGNEWPEVRIRRLDNKTDLNDRLDGVFWSDATWTKDNRGFFYVRSIKPAVGERTAMKGPTVYYHVVGTPQSADVSIFGIAPDVTDLVVEHDMSDDGRFVFIYEGNGADVDGIGWTNTRMYTIDLGNPLRPNISAPVIPLNKARDASYFSQRTNGDSVYLFTDLGAPKRRLVVYDVKNPAPSAWRDVIAESDELIDKIDYINDRWVVTIVRNVQHSIRVYTRDGKLLRELLVPSLSVVGNVRAGLNRDELIVESREGFAPMRKRYDVVTGAVAVDRAAKLPPGVDAYEIKQVWYPSKDGVRVPMFVAHRRGLKLDATHPTILAGYGASNQLSLPYFDEWAVAGLELGFVLALPALRGGGEFGRTWYEAATFERKQTTFDDFIAAAEYLIKERYTSSERLAILGSSNGGLLVTAVINQRPELFRVAIAGVPQTDNIRYDRGRHIMQFGTPKDSAQFRYLLAYSPLHNVKKGACYPSTLITTALNDDRAPAWMALKHAAALQAAQGCDRPILLRADTGGGHMGNEDEDAGDFIAFVARELGVNRSR